eukprot:gene42711-51795_t
MSQRHAAPRQRAAAAAALLLAAPWPAAAFQELAPGVRLDVITWNVLGREQALILDTLAARYKARDVIFLQETHHSLAVAAAEHMDFN